ncbi:DEAD/DEAH box helicase [Mesorhizobium japonicum]|uniref:Mlr5479 protein n=1 Tax=Mesorhizobium japonicum (strain LMG 29417 / CECT 9101 / MAFF 303099) TaxID=266835 RepID=Q98BP7_RHILO|nr:DEAD/DEAH box helicase family protein [Mesorhizobium japonicum]BAB51925.1 mlr5479 [Mesorhizobium japonicum MAFF 303099]
MRLDDLIFDKRTSISALTKPLIDRAGFRRDMGQLGRYGFWSQAGASPHLWEHQKVAIGTVVAYLNANRTIPERPEHQEAALLKLPTGTGKSGIIAVLSRCLPGVRKVLVLTPREALTKQLLKDIRFRFWGHIGYSVNDGQLFTAVADSFGENLETVYTETFLPSRCAALHVHLENADRAVLVGTHQALDKIRRTALKDGGVCARLLERIKETFDLIIVDEGHYEPAVSWSHGVRDFNLPTLLLSATPYRNDYKSFRVRGRFLFNYPYAEAVADRIIRPVEVIVPNDDHASGGDAVSRFVALLRSELFARLQTTDRWFKNDGTLPKVMVRADDLDTLEALQSAINAAFGTRSVLIHDRAKKTDQNHDRFTSVSSAASARPDAQFWIHQFKLMEGIDDSSFVAVAIFDLMGNARQLVQQIGRATRYSNGDRRVKQTGWVIASPANARRIRTSWERYTAYEVYAADNVAFIVSNEVTLPDRLLNLMAEYQYIGGEFRGRFEIEAPLAAGDIQLPQSAAVLRMSEPFADILALGPQIEEAILDEDRFKITPIEGMPANTIGFSYYAWRNSPLLIDRFFSEWKLGIFIAVRQDEFVLMHDTEGLVVDMAKLGLKRADRALLEKAFPEADVGTPTKLSRLSFTSLEMSQQAIRSMAVRTRSFEKVFTDLLDPSLVPASAFGFVNGGARYVGFLRSRIRDAAERNVPVQEYVDWTAQVAAELRDEERTRSDVFGRYAQVVEGLSLAEATPASILLDFSKDGFADAQDDDAAAQGDGNPEVDYDDLCADVDQETGEFTIKIGGADIPCSIEYREDAGKYRLKSEALNDRFRPDRTDDRRQPQTLVQRLNQSQSFRIIVQRNGVVYSEGRFYEPRLRWTGEGGAKPILDYIFSAACLRHVTSEKGEAIFGGDRNGWYKTSIFGLFSAVGGQQLAAAGIAEDDLTRAISSYPIWLCDDDNQEITDFIGLDEERKKLVFAHAKMGKQEEGGTGFNVSSLQDVGRQALASLAFISRSEPSPVWTAERWQSNVRANTVLLDGRNRIFKDGPGLAPDQLNERLIRACRNPSFDKEIWIVGATMVRRAALSQGLDAPAPSNRLRQFLMHWDALQTGCARASVRLRLFCD